MEHAAAPRSAPARVLPLWVVGSAFWALVLAVVAASIVVEALPFILLGAAASAAIAV